MSFKRHSKHDLSIMVEDKLKEMNKMMPLMMTHSVFLVRH